MSKYEDRVLRRLRAEFARTEAGEPRCESDCGRRCMRVAGHVGHHWHESDCYALWSNKGERLGAAFPRVSP